MMIQTASLLRRAERWREVARRRGIDVEIRTGRRQTETPDIVDEHRVGRRKLALLRWTGWRYYSRAFGSRPADLAILCGNDDNGPWARRVVGSCTTVLDALASLEPAAVRKARAAGSRVVRQGDVYAVERRRDCARNTDLPDGHTWDPATRTLAHGSHASTVVPFPCRFFSQTRQSFGGKD